MDQLLHVLHDSLSHDQGRLDNAAKMLSMAQQQDMPWLLQALLVILTSPNNNSCVRQQAGLQLKRLLLQYLTSDTIDQDLLDTIKQNLLQNIGTESWQPSTIAQVRLLNMYSIF